MTNSTEAPMANAIDDVKLLPCPFCGGEALSANRTGSAWFIHADHSKNCTLAEFHRTELDAISNWNRRAMSQLLDPIDITINPMGTAPSGEDAMEPSEIDVHEGAWAVVIGTNGKTAGWIDTHALFAHQIYRHHILTSPAPSQHTGWSDEAVEALIDAVMSVERYAPKTVPMGANPPLFDGMQPDNDGPWVSRVNVAKRLRAAFSKIKSGTRISAGILTDQVILELRAAQHVLGYPEALGDAIEAIAGIEEERVRLWNEVRDLKSSLNVERASTDTMWVERDAAVGALRNIAEGNLGDEPWQANYDRIRQAAKEALTKVEVHNLPVPAADPEIVEALKDAFEYFRTEGVHFDRDSLAGKLHAAIDKVERLPSWSNLTDEAVKVAWDRYVETSMDSDNSNLDCMRAALTAAASITASRDAGPQEWVYLVHDWEHNNPSLSRGYEYARTPERANQLLASGAKLTTVYTRHPASEFAASPAQPVQEQEPVAWRYKWGQEGDWFVTLDRPNSDDPRSPVFGKMSAVEPLYRASPPEQELKRLYLQKCKFVDEKVSEWEAAEAKVERLTEALREMVDLMDSGEEPGCGSDWHARARAALSAASSIAPVTGFEVKALEWGPESGLGFHRAMTVFGEYVVTTDLGVARALWWFETARRGTENISTTIEDAKAAAQAHFNAAIRSSIPPSVPKESGEP